MKLALALGLLLLASAHAGCDYSNPSYTYLLLVQQWPPSSCDNFGCTTPDSQFTLHGLWPSRDTSSYPCSCTNEQFDPSKVSSILPELEKAWPSFNGQDDSFWSHEYEKHGTCTTQFTSELGFFSGVLKLRQANNISMALDDASIIPGNSYSFSQVTNAIKSNLGGIPLVNCNNYQGQQLLSSISMCLDMNLNVMDCQSEVLSESYCTQSAPLFYPKPQAAATPALRGVAVQE